MNINQITEELVSLVNRVNGINSWIKANPNITDPNAYEIMDCNIQFAEIIAKLKAYYIEAGEIPADLDKTNGIMATVNFLAAVHPEIEKGYNALGTMDDLRSIAIHPFFTTTEAEEMYCSIKACQDNANYIIPADEGMRRIKRELLCKSMSVPFYIWQVHRNEPDYQYDNITEFESMQSMNSLYQGHEKPSQFASQVDSLMKKIESNYKYSTQGQDQITQPQK